MVVWNEPCTVLELRTRQFQPPSGVRIRAMQRTKSCRRLSLTRKYDAMNSAMPVMHSSDTSAFGFFDVRPPCVDSAHSDQLGGDAALRCKVKRCVHTRTSTADCEHEGATVAWVVECVQ